MMMEGMISRKRRRSPSPENIDHAKRAAIDVQAHLNGTSMSFLSLLLSPFFLHTQNYKPTFLFTVAGMVTLQSLQNLANLQNLPQVASLAAGLQSMTTGLTNNQLINTPLNLTVSSSSKRRTFLFLILIKRFIKYQMKEK